MSEIVVSSSSDRDDREIDEYHDESNSIDSGSDTDSSQSSSSGGNTTDEQYSSRVPGIPLEVLKEELRMRAMSRSSVGLSTSASSSVPSPKEEILYCCIVGIPSRTNEKRLASLKGLYQIPDNLNPRLATPGDWCCAPNYWVGIYEAYLLGGLRLPLNAFAREILHRLGIGINQLNPNAWRLIISMQVLWREIFYGNYPVTVDAFLYFYKPSEIIQSLGFY